MKIIFFTRFFYPHIGGVEKHVMEVSKKLFNQGNSITILTERYDTSLPKTEFINGVLIHRIKADGNRVSKKINIWKSLLSHTRVILSADIIHVHDVYFWYLPFRFLFPWKKSYITFHGYEGIFPPRNTAVLQRRLYNFLSRGSISVGEFIKKWYKTNFDFVTYGGIDANATKNSKDKTQNNNLILKIIFIGRFEKDTGVLDYLNVLEELKRKKVKFEFKSFGMGSLKKELEKFGPVNLIESLSDQIQKADIVFASSYLSMLDSIANKKMVVAVYDNLLKKDYIRLSPFNKFTIHGNNTKLIVDQIISYKNNPRFRAKVVNDGYKWAKKQSWENVANYYLKLWRK